MRKFCYTFILLFISYLFLPSAAKAFSGGSGTSGSPWQIANVADLVQVGTYAGASSSGKYFLLTADLDLNVSPYNAGVGWLSIGNTSLRFQGNFDGNNHTISNLFISTSTQYVGFFGYVQNATISNLGLTNAAVTSSNLSDSVGILIGAGSVTSSNNYTTGIVSSSNSAGGLIGLFSGGTVSTSYSSATVRGNGFGDGGLIGASTAGSIYSSYATGNVVGFQQAGGFIGNITGSTLVSSSYATGNITATASGGGFAGGSSQAYIYNSYATGNATTSGSNVGSFIGFAQGTTLVNGTHVSSSYATGNVSGNSSCGGFVGNTTFMSISDSYGIGRVACTSASGGYAGTVSGASLTNVYSTGVVTQAAGGGLIGTVGGSGVTTSSVYWDTQTSGKAASAGGATGKTTAQMKDQTTFVGWDFTNIWNIDGVNNSGYPYLRVQTVPDVTSPTVSSVFPTDNATSVSSTANLVINFSEAVVPSTTGSITIYNNDGSIFESIIASSSQVTGASTTQIIINPNSNLTSQASYYVLISSTAFADTSGNLYAGVSSTSYWNFTVADEISPTVSSVFPTDNATSVSSTANLVINFSEAVVPSTTGSITIYNNDGSIFESIIASSSQVTGASTTQIIINPNSNLTSQASYYVLISSTAFADSSGNAYAGISSTSAWNFTVADEVNPTASSIFPADNATTTSSTVNLVINFSEAITPSTTGSITIYNSDGSIFEAIVASSSKVTGSGTAQIIINPNSTLTSQASYYVLISSTAFADASGNLYAGISNSTTWNFTIADETNPTVSSVSPVDNTTSVTTTANLVINFSEAVVVQTGNIIIYKSLDNSIFESISVTSSQVIGTGTTQIIINPVSNFDYQTDYYVLVSSTAFADASGNFYAGITSTSAWNFTVVSDNSSQNSSASTGPVGTAIVYSAPSVGNGNTDLDIGMYQSRYVGFLDSGGINILAYVGSQAIFSTLVSKTSTLEEHQLKIDDVDILMKRVFFTISSEPIQLALNLNESIEIDLDGDGINDIEATFSSLWINRVEITIFPLINNKQKPVLFKNNFVFTRDLHTGMSGEDVRQLQIYLNSTGFVLATLGPGSSGKETLKFGMLTRKALINFQRKNKIYPAIGYFGPITKKVIRANNNY